MGYCIGCFGYHQMNPSCSLGIFHELYQPGFSDFLKNYNMAKHNSILLLPLIITSLTLGSAKAMSTKQIAQKKPHIILIVADDLGWNDVSWNNPYVVSPNLNDLAVNGVILNQSYVQPTCTPTRSALMTGRYPFTIGLQQGVIGPMEPMGVPLRAQMLPRFLKKAGYTTHAIGKWHLGFCSWDYTPLKRGFDTFYGYYTGSEDYYSHKRAASRTGKKKKKKGKKRRGKDDYDDDDEEERERRFRGGSKEYLDLRNNTRVDDKKGGVYSTYIFASAAEEVIRSRKPKDPMFMYIAFQSVHSPLQVPREYMIPYRHIKYYERRVYLGMVTAMDEAIGKVITALKETGHYENSVIIFTTDNGGSVKKGGSNWPLRGGKASLWEGGTRGPAFIHSPLLPNPGTVTEHLHHVTDWFSTISSIAGVLTLPKVDGVNQWDALTGTSQVPQREAMIYNMDDSQKYKAGLRMSNYKLLVGGMARKSWVSLPESEDAPRRKTNNKKKKRPKGFNTKRLQQLFKPSPAALLSENGQKADLPPSDAAGEGQVTKDTQEVLDSGPSTENHNGSSDIPADSLEEPASYELLDDQPDDSDSMQDTSSSLEDFTSGEYISVKSMLRTMDDEYIFWKELKNDPTLFWENRVLNILGGYFRDRTKIRLYNLQDDPEERVNLAAIEPNRTQTMLSFLAQELLRYKVPLIRRDKARAHPTYWKNVWTPGWCQSLW
ncbi:arylsulfatase B-like isoform X2 [Macrobrachium rosenbergii]|uniref:arylsulfatase B-like isoform X2 n=1 Tax=Macrobrachium rosenbergii TaxID=79674 RepID=UPI0034D458A2